MASDEDFAANLRPDNIFGVGGLSDYFDEDELTPEGDDLYATEIPHYTQARPAANAVGSAPVAVSGTPVADGSAPSSLGAAVTLFFLLGGAGLGWYYGGLKGAAGGAVVGGGLRNLYRAQKTFSSDTMGAVKQGAIGAVGLAGGGYLLWTADRK